MRLPFGACLGVGCLGVGCGVHGVPSDRSGPADRTAADTPAAPSPEGATSHPAHETRMRPRVPVRAGSRTPIDHLDGWQAVGGCECARQGAARRRHIGGARRDDLAHIQDPIAAPIPSPSGDRGRPAPCDAGARGRLTSRSAPLHSSPVSGCCGNLHTATRGPTSPERPCSPARSPRSCSPFRRAIPGGGPALGSSRCSRGAPSCSSRWCNARAGGRTQRCRSNCSANVRSRLRTSEACCSAPPSPGWHSTTFCSCATSGTTASSGPAGFPSSHPCRRGRIGSRW